MALPSNQTHRVVDYAEEQLNEIEALQSIYPEEYEELESEPHSFRILVNPEEEVEEFPCSLYLNVTYTPTYPDELPEYKIEVIEGDFSSEELEKFTEELKTLVRIDRILDYLRELWRRKRRKRD
ncbi:hypothetical protein K493DRAFT_365014 [Basidiobolus meristosporus CBS 931.73]|uniref:RWD domain-containing protein n=1 Tax=Basidiobolus meristosporus CBS 931.73 TaxID=1314790 RepID=A0A1Y1VS93_9FUNG|nr:hypothetical protein K493DRAFT_365014 [Basidiobolus meristosporus CBS 931.73]|eukprot:ORX64149.1 hypothetical protein K493DRAFT_365014 [Basidiobolus meristosporus CBS 931.73]